MEFLVPGGGWGCGHSGSFTSPSDHRAHLWISSVSFFLKIYFFKDLFILHKNPVIQVVINSYILNSFHCSLLLELFYLVINYH